MALDGRITIDALFHDTDGTTSLKIVSLEDTKNYTTGKVAIVSGTVGTAAVTLWNQGDGIAFGGYKDANGSAVSFFAVNRFALRGSGSGVKVEDTETGIVELISVNNDLAIGNNVGAELKISSLSGTASFTAVLYGT